MCEFVNPRMGELYFTISRVRRTCADPRDLPFSNEAGEGFENKIAELFARKLGKSVAYTFYPDATGFIRLNGLRLRVNSTVNGAKNMAKLTRITVSRRVGERVRAMGRGGVNDSDRTRCTAAGRLSLLLI